jgi:hypothetical protein
MLQGPLPQSQVAPTDDRGEHWVSSPSATDQRPQAAHAPAWLSPKLEIGATKEVAARTNQLFELVTAYRWNNAQ